MHNGQPTGAQNASTTEDGSYYLNGAVSNTALQAVVRKANATCVIPSEDEWYKAAYYEPNRPGGAGYYWDYPTRSNMAPGNALDPNGTNLANYNVNNIETIGSPYYRTEAGAFTNSYSAYGTFDQGGNVWEWNEAVIGSGRTARGGNYWLYENYLRAAGRGSTTLPTNESAGFGFRIAYVPEPGSALLLLAGSSAAVVRRRLGQASSPRRYAGAVA
jgi:formylglycine-generating enzyme required for sulfatase activity